MSSTAVLERASRPAERTAAPEAIHKAAASPGRVIERRFTDSAWQVPPWSTVAEAWRAWAELAEAMAAAVPAGQFAPMLKMNVSLFTNMLAPSNAIATNPVALKRAIDTGGRSIL